MFLTPRSWPYVPTTATGALAHHTETHVHLEDALHLTVANETPVMAAPTNDGTAAHVRQLRPRASAPTVATTVTTTENVVRRRTMHVTVRCVKGGNANDYPNLLPSPSCSPFRPQRNQARMLLRLKHARRYQIQLPCQGSTPLRCLQSRPATSAT